MGMNGDTRPRCPSHDPADCPVCDQHTNKGTDALTPTQADRAGDNYFERLTEVADRRFR